ncbi:MAG: hypothetical protein ABL894_09600 [Hyphomicrobium sp.]
MNRRSKIMWGLSIALLAWTVAMAVVSGLNAGCARRGERFSVCSFACVPLGPPIILQRDLLRS